MQPIKTSRGTLIKKIKAAVQQCWFSLQDIILAQGDFSKELVEMHRYKGTEIDSNQLSQFIANVEAIKQKAEQEFLLEFNKILPITNSKDDPVIVEVEVDFKPLVEYYTSPFVEEVIAENNIVKHDPLDAYIKEQN